MTAHDAELSGDDHAISRGPANRTAARSRPHARATSTRQGLAR